MYKTILATASALTIFASMPAVAAENGQATAPKAQKSRDVSEDAKEAWQNVKRDASNAYEDIKAVFVDSNKDMVISTQHTAGGILGSAVYNQHQEHVGTVKDIILDADGNANMVVIADSEFPGFDGKLVAFDYNAISRQNADGDVIIPITEDTIDEAAEFSYDRNAESDGKVRVIPNQGYSVSELLDGSLVDPKGNSVADVEDITFRGGKASELIVGFDKILGIGGKKAVLSYDAAKIIRDGDDLDFKLTARQAAQFDTYKKTAMNP